MDRGAAHISHQPTKLWAGFVQLPVLGTLLLSVLSVVSLYAQAEVTSLATFDDSPAPSIAFIVDTPEPFMYQGLVWRGFSVIQSNHESLVRFPRSGYSKGAVSGSFAAVAAGRAVSESTIERRGGDPFVFYGAHLTAAWRTGLEVKVEGRRGEALVFSREMVVSPTRTVHLSGAWRIDRLHIRASGGEDGDICPNADCSPGPEVIVDDVEFSLAATALSEETVLSSSEAVEKPVGTAAGQLVLEPAPEPAEALIVAAAVEKPQPSIESASPPETPAGRCASDVNYGVQVGAFGIEANGRRLKRVLSQTYGVVRVFRRQHDDKTLYHLVVGCTGERGEAATLFGTLLAEGTKGIVVQVSAGEFGDPL